MSSSTATPLPLPRARWWVLTATRLPASMIWAISIWKSSHCSGHAAMASMTPAWPCRVVPSGTSGGCITRISGSIRPKNVSMLPREKASNAARTISTFSCDITRAVSRRLRSRRERLAPTGSGLRGPPLLGERLHPEDLSRPQPESNEDGQLSLSTARPSAPFRVRDHQHPWSPSQELTRNDLETVVRVVERLEIGVREPVVSSNLGLDRHEAGLEIEVRGRQIDESLK